MDKNTKTILMAAGVVAAVAYLNKLKPVNGIGSNIDFPAEGIDIILPLKEFRALTIKERKKYIKRYQEEVNRARILLRYAEEFTPNKVGQRQYELTTLLVNAPVSIF